MKIFGKETNKTKKITPKYFKLINCNNTFADFNIFVYVEAR